MSLEFKPESIDTLRRRYLSALSQIWPLNIENELDRPGRHRCNTFDFEDGTRLIVSRHRGDDGDLVVHVSGSMSTMKPGEDKRGVEVLLHRYGQISGVAGALLALLPFTARGAVAHFAHRANPSVEADSARAWNDARVGGN